MRFLLDERSHQQMLSHKDHSPDCYARPGEYLHHMYVKGIKFVVARALINCLKEAQAKGDKEAARHLQLHKTQFDQLAAVAKKRGTLARSRMLGDPVPKEGDTPTSSNSFVPKEPTTLQETGLSRVFIQETILRSIYNKGQPTGGEIAREIRIPYPIVSPILAEMRTLNLVDIIGQSGIGDATYQYVLKNPRGAQAVEDALKKTSYMGAAPIPFKDYLAAVEAQTIKSLTVTRRNIQKAFQDLIITNEVFSEIGPAINSADSIFLFGFPGNGKTSIAERITRLMGDDVFIPHAIEADGQIVKIFDGIVHNMVEEPPDDDLDFGQFSGPKYDTRYVKIKRPVVIVGGELIMSMLDLAYNDIGKFYEAPLQMKANLGIFMIDDFGRQQVRPMDLLNRWIVPLEKRYDYLTTVTGKKLQIPFDELLIFSTNLDPHDLADEAFLRRIKFKIEIRDPTEAQWRQIWELVCKKHKITVDQKGLDYLLDKWYTPHNRPLRMCQPRDILNQMLSISRYNMESTAFTPDLIDAACTTYFISTEQKDFGTSVRMD